MFNIYCLFLGKKFYNMNVITLADYLGKRYNKATEMLLGFAISISYLGWTAAQFIAFGYVLSHICGGLIDKQSAIVIGAIIPLLYTFKGGLSSVAINDFIQTIMIVAGLIITLLYVIKLDNINFSDVMNYALYNDNVDFEYNVHYPNIWVLFGAVLTMILGTVPQARYISTYHLKM